MATSSQYDIRLWETFLYSTIESDEKRGNKKLKSQIKKRSKLTKKYFKNGKTENDLDALNILSSECTKLLLVSNKKNMFETWVENWMTA